MITDTTAEMLTAWRSFCLQEGVDLNDKERRRHFGIAFLAGCCVGADLEDPAEVLLMGIQKERNRHGS